MTSGEQRLTTFQRVIALLYAVLVRYLIEWLIFMIAVYKGSPLVYLFGWYFGVLGCILFLAFGVGIVLYMAYYILGPSSAKSVMTPLFWLSFALSVIAWYFLLWRRRRSIVKQMIEEGYYPQEWEKWLKKIDRNKK